MRIRDGHTFQKQQEEMVTVPLYMYKKKARAFERFFQFGLRGRIYNEDNNLFYDIHSGFAYLERRVRRQD